MATKPTNSGAPFAASVARGAGGARAFQLIVAFRYLRRNWLSYLAIVGVALSVTVLIVVMSVMTGFDEELRSRIRGTLAHLIVESAYQETFGGYEPILAKVEALPDVAACAPHLEGPALIRVGKSYRWGYFSGIDLARESKATQFDAYWRAGMGERGYERTAYVLGRIQKYLNDLGVALPTRAVVERLDKLLAEHPKLKGLKPEQKERLRQTLKRYGKLAVDEAKNMGEADFRRLASDERELLRRWAAENGIDLRADFRRNETARPTWGPASLLQDEHEAPCIPGRDLVVAGRDVQGDELSLDIGDELVVVTPVGLEERGIKSCRIAGKFKSGMYEYDFRQIYLPLEVVQKLMRKSGEVSSINVKLRDYGGARQVRAQILGILTPEELDGWFRALRPALEPKARPGREAAELRELVERDLEQLRTNYDEWMATGNPLAPEYHKRAAASLERLSKLVEEDADARVRADMAGARSALRALRERREKGVGPNYRVWTWEDKRRNTLRAVWLERRILGLILFLLVLVSGFVILAILHTTVMAKTKDIGILKAIGARMGGILSVFLLNGLMIGVIGSALGVLGGRLLCAYLNVIEDLLYRWFHFRVFPRDVYSLDKIPTAQDPGGFIVIIAVVAVAVSFLAALYPAWRAARMDPVETVRYE